MKVFNISGTIGDTYAACCKLNDLKEPIKIFHIQPYPQFNNIIRKIYALIPNIIEVNILNTDDYSKFDPKIPMIDAHCKRHPVDPDYIKMNFFPNFEFESNEKFNFEFPYIVLQPKAGRTEQLREMRLKTVKKIIKNSKYKVVLVGTSKKYENVDNCINLINKTTLFEALNIIKNSRYFIGLFGIMTMVALSHRINCNYIYNDDLEMKAMIYNMPWEKYSHKKISLEDYLKSGYSIRRKIKTLFFEFLNIILKMRHRISIKNLFQPLKVLSILNNDNQNPRIRLILNFFMEEKK